MKKLPMQKSKQEIRDLKAPFKQILKAGICPDITLIPDILKRETASGNVAIFE